MSLTFCSKMILKNPSIFVAGASEEFFEEDNVVLRGNGVEIRRRIGNRGIIL